MMLSAMLFHGWPASKRNHLSAATRTASDNETILELATDNIDSILAAFPKPDPMGKRNLLLRYIGKRSKPGDGVLLLVRDDYPVIFADGEKEFSFILKSAIEEKLVEPIDSKAQVFYRLSFKGWAQFKESEETVARERRAGTLLSSQYIRTQVERMQSNIEKDPELAIGTAKEFLETLSKTILKSQDVSYEEDWKFPKLFKTALRELQLVASGSETKKAHELIERLLQQTGAIADTLAQLRNEFGTGHGKDHSHEGLEPRHAHLIVQIVSAVGEYVAESPRKPKPQP